MAISIADDGPGMPPEAGDRVFDMFFSGSNRAADSRRSLGLGLALCRSIITAHGGDDLPFAEPAAWRGIPFYPACRGGAMA